VWTDLIAHVPTRGGALPLDSLRLQKEIPYRPMALWASSMCLMHPASLPFFISGLRHVEMHRRFLLLGGVVVQYRGYIIEVSRETSGWRAGVYPRSPDPSSTEATSIATIRMPRVIEAMDRWTGCFVTNLNSLRDGMQVCSAAELLDS
jgi:hypothetical protein